jgi:hypothetical protein
MRQQAPVFYACFFYLFGCSMCRQAPVLQTLLPLLNRYEPPAQGKPPMPLRNTSNASSLLDPEAVAWATQLSLLAMHACVIMPRQVFVCLSVRPSVRPSGRPPVRPPVRPSIRPSSAMHACGTMPRQVFVCLPVCQSVHTSARLLVRPSSAMHACGIMLEHSRAGCRSTPLPGHAGW